MATVNVHFDPTADAPLEVLFLAPTYAYAKKVISNQEHALDRNHIPNTTSKDPGKMYIHTDRVHIEVVYKDPVEWTPGLFARRHAVFGKKELVAKAGLTFYAMRINAPSISLTKFIKEAHERGVIDDVEPRTSYLPEIVKVHFNNPVTVVIWADGTKTTVKCDPEDWYDEHVGLAMCIAKKAFGNTGRYYEVFKKHVPEHTPLDPGVFDEIMQKIYDCLLPGSIMR